MKFKAAVPAEIYLYLSIETLERPLKAVGKFWQGHQRCGAIAVTYLLSNIISVL